MFEYIILGILQGVFEWLPISSEGVVVLVGQFFSADFNLVDIALFLHLGTFFAVLIYFRKDWIEILTFKNKKMLKFLTITTVVALAVSYPIYGAIRNIAVGSSLLILVGFGLLFTAYFSKRKKKLNISENNLAVISGVLQGLAVIPGLSRSGATIFGLSLKKDDSLDILKTSYLMSGPVVLASSFYLLLNDSSLVISMWPALIASFVAGLLTLSALLKFAKKIDFFKFLLLFSGLCFVGAIIAFLV